MPHRHVVRFAELSELLSGLSGGRRRFAVRIQLENLAGKSADQVHLLPWTDVEPARKAGVLPFPQVLSVAIEYLHSSILPIGHVNEPFGVDDDRVRCVELSWPGALPAPRFRELAALV